MIVTNKSYHSFVSLAATSSREAIRPASLASPMNVLQLHILVEAGLGEDEVVGEAAPVRDLGPDLVALALHEGHQLVARALRVRLADVTELDRESLNIEKSY